MRPKREPQIRPETSKLNSGISPTRMFDPAGVTSVLQPRQLAILFKSWHMIGQEGSRRAMVLNPRRLNVETVPVNRLDVLPGSTVSTGYASSAGALARFAAFNASTIRAVMMPRLRYRRLI